MKVRGLFNNAQKVLQIPAGTLIFEEGDERDFMYGIIEGTVELHQSGALLTTVGPDEVFGEMAMIDKLPRTATAVAVTDCVVAAIDERMFLLLVHETPMFAIQVMSTLASKLRASTTRGHV